MPMLFGLDRVFHPHRTGTIKQIIFPIMPTYNMPQVFQNNWSPQVMPMTNLELPNNFANFNLNAMGGGGGYPM
jgi:hypothetical protein